MNWINLLFIMIWNLVSQGTWSSDEIQARSKFELQMRGLTDGILKNYIQEIFCWQMELFVET